MRAWHFHHNADGTITMYGVTQRRSDSTRDDIARRGLRDGKGVWGPGVYAALPGTRSHNPRGTGCYNHWGKWEYTVRATVPADRCLIVDTREEYVRLYLGMTWDEKQEYLGRYDAVLVLLDEDKRCKADIVNQWRARQEHVRIVDGPRPVDRGWRRVGA